MDEKYEIIQGLIEDGLLDAAATVVSRLLLKEPLSGGLWALSMKIDVARNQHSVALKNHKHVQTIKEFLSDSTGEDELFSSIGERAILEEKLNFEQTTEEEEYRDFRLHADLSRSKSRTTLKDESYLFIGNCQTGPVALGLALRAPHAQVFHSQFILDQENWVEQKKIANTFKLLSECKYIYLQPRIHTLFRDQIEQNRRADSEVRYFPNLYFSGYHPDIINLDVMGKSLLSPMAKYNSIIVLFGWCQDLSPDETVALFNENTYKQLGFHEFWENAKQYLLRTGEEANLSFDPYIQKWLSGDVCFFTPPHPKNAVIEDVIKTIVKRDRIETTLDAVSMLSPEVFARLYVWPVYPNLCNETSPHKGHTTFKTRDGVLSLKEFVISSYEHYQKHGASKAAVFEELSTRVDRAKLDQLRSNPTGAQTKLSEQKTSPNHAYKDLERHQYWGKVFSQDLPMDFVPKYETKFQIDKGTKIATAGSCFAVHISKHLLRNGFNFYRTEPEHQTPSSAGDSRSALPSFSAQYGNIYSSTQLLQLFERATGAFEPRDLFWKRFDSVYVDPFRPLVAGDGFADTDTLFESRSKHLECVLDLFKTLDVFVFTLGLTEVWRNRADGAAFPIAPSVLTGQINDKEYEFYNMSCSDVVQDMEMFVDGLRTINPDAKIILTVSPVPLVATFEQRNVLISNTYSKSTLRSAAEEVCRNHANVDYFPSYEIITGHYNKSHYFNRDLRSVTPLGVAHVMKSFFATYGNTSIEQDPDEEILESMKMNSIILCDEELYNS